MEAIAYQQKVHVYGYTLTLKNVPFVDICCIPLFENGSTSPEKDSSTITHSNQTQIKGDTRPIMYILLTPFLPIKA